MDRFQIEDRTGATEIEEVLAHTSIAGSATLAACEMSEAMLDSRAGAQAQAAEGGRRSLSQALLERLVGRNGDGSSLPGVASVQSTRSGQGSQAALENCAGEPRRIGSVWPAGQM